MQNGNIEIIIKEIIKLVESIAAEDEGISAAVLQTESCYEQNFSDIIPPAFFLELAHRIKINGMN